MMGRRTTSALLVALAATAALALGAAVATAAPPATGLANEELISDPSQGSITATTPCQDDGGTSFDFTATGNAVGPYPGTFTASGHVTLGPLGPGTPPPDVQPQVSAGVGQVTSLSEQFTITSGDTTITGTKAEGGQFDIAAFNAAQCANVSGEDFTNLPDASGTIYSFEVGSSYTATIDDPSGSYRVDGGAVTGPAYDTNLSDAQGSFQQSPFTEFFFTSSPPGPAVGPPAAVTLQPAASSDPVGTSHTVAATAQDAHGAPVPGAGVAFTVTGDQSTTGACTTDASGQCSFTYAGPTTPGTDAITGCAGPGGGAPCGTASETWVPGAPAVVTLSPAVGSDAPGGSHTVTATVTDALANPLSGVPVSFTVTGSVATTGSCVTGPAGQCGFTYAGPVAPGADAITGCAGAGGGPPCGSATETWTLPASTAGCAVTDGGAITAADGDHGQFGGNASVSSRGVASGQQDYHDQGPAAQVVVHGLGVDAIICDPTRSVASIFAHGTLNGSTPVQFEVDLTDPDGSGGHDTYRIRTSSGYDSGVQPTSATGAVEIR